MRTQHGVWKKWLLFLNVLINFNRKFSLFSMISIHQMYENKVERTEVLFFFFHNMRLNRDLDKVKRWKRAMVRLTSLVGWDVRNM